MKEKPQVLFATAAFAVLGVALSAWAVPVSEELSEIAVQNWLRNGEALCKMSTGATTVAPETYTATNGATFRVVRLKAGGFVITSTDTDLEPIVAYSGCSDFTADANSPLWRMLEKDLSVRQTRFLATTASKASVLTSAQAKWSRLTDGASEDGILRMTRAYAASSDGAVADVRVEPLLESTWGQGDAGGQRCYNYYTPDNYPCGCVATAGAQIMRYFCYPTGFVTPKTTTCQVQSSTTDLGDGYYRVNYSWVYLTMQGGIYAWDQMPLKPTGFSTLAQCQAIGKLTSDFGIAAQTQYAKSGSGTGGYLAAPVLKDTFGYASAQPIVGEQGESVMRNLLLSNLDAKLPVLVSVSGDGGHAVVADGYGYSSGKLYVHFNMGWGGYCDSWYTPPVVDDFTSIDGYVYNINTTGSDEDVVCSGRVLSSITGLPIAGATVSVANASQQTRGSCTTDENGIYALILTAGDHEIIAQCESEAATNRVFLNRCVGTGIVGTSYYTSQPGSCGNQTEVDFSLTISEPTPDPTPSEQSVLVKAVTGTPATDTGAVVYDGFLQTADGAAIVGTIQVKAAKTKAGATLSKLTIVLQEATSTKKTTLSRTYDTSLAEVQTIAGKGLSVSLLLGANGMTGTVGEYVIVGVPNVFSAKDAASKAAAAAAESAYVGTYNLKADEGLFTVTVAKKGKVKVTGTTAAGQKVSVTAQLLAGDDVACVPVVAPKVGLAFTVWLGDSATVVGLTNAMAGPAGTLAAGAAFTLDGAVLASVSVAQGSTKWIVADGAKAGSEGNPSSLKLTYTAKTGTFKGSFKVYVSVNGRRQAISAAVTGVLINGIGYGMATAKKVGSVAVEIKP